jgi:hypothetical protein
VIANLQAQQKRHRWTVKLKGSTRRLSQSEKPSLTWRLIAGRRSRPGEAHGLLRAWQSWEQISHALWPRLEIPGSPHHMIRIRVVPHRGAPLTLPDGTQIQTNAMIAELHCDNHVVLKIATRGGNPFAAFREELRCLSRWVQRDGLGREVGAFYARTILDKAAGRMGFAVTVAPLTIRRRMERFFFKGLLVIYNEQGLGRIAVGSTPHRYPSDLWLSRRDLIRRYSDLGVQVRALDDVSPKPIRDEERALRSVRTA